ncbi:hypothetical protein L6452_24397 [Arctium lappa]|uniref:Uncharacterized protein n=1 Tax=Arctium lappa TaxID=4217 RepID=A0ACB9A9U7_ARCLA|nr:hypothetical protein L6452_24397 [Arctium lappa]
MGDLENNVEKVEVPPFFICPISLEIMKDPVTLPTGITYDRESIEKWLFAKKNNTCPVTKNIILDHVDLTPNHTLRRLIQSWCTLNPLSGVERVPTPRLPISKPQILKLLKDLKQPNLQMKTLKRLKLIVLENETNKRSMEAVGAVDYLANVLADQNNVTSSYSSAGEYSDDDVEGFELDTPADEALGVLYHMQISETGLQGLFAKTGDFVDTLTRVMQRAASYESRTYAVLLLKSMFDATQRMQVATTMSLKPEFFAELVNVLIDQISQKATKATLKLLINVCVWGRNRIRAAEAGAVGALIDILLDSTDKRVSEMVLLALDQLCQCAEGRSEVLKHGAGLAVVSKKIFRVSPVASDRAVRILHSVAKFSGNTGVVAEMLQLGVVGKLCLVLQVDCGSKMKERAMEILKMHARAWNNSPCIPHNLISSYPS